MDVTWFALGNIYLSLPRPVFVFFWTCCLEISYGQSRAPRPRWQRILRWSEIVKFDRNLDRRGAMEACQYACVEAAAKGLSTCSFIKKCHQIQQWTFIPHSTLINNSSLEDETIYQWGQVYKRSLDASCDSYSYASYDPHIHAYHTSICVPISCALPQNVWKFNIQMKMCHELLTWIHM